MISSDFTIFYKLHLFSSNGMNSMNQISIFQSFTKSMNEKISSSLNPHITTQFSFRALKWALSAFSIVSRTAGSPFSLLVMKSNLASTRESIDMLRWVSPHYLSSGTFHLIFNPLVVIANDFINGKFKSDIMSIKSFQTVGSPPVSQILSTPACTNS